MDGLAAAGARPHRLQWADSDLALPPVGPAGLAVGGLPVAPVSAVLPLQAGGAAVGQQVAAPAAEDDGRTVSTCLLSKKSGGAYQAPPLLRI